MVLLPEEKMSEAEVSIRLGLFLLREKLATGDVDVAIDGAQVRTGDRVHFPIAEFLESEQIERVGEGAAWQATYTVPGSMNRLVIHSSPGLGDVVAPLSGGRMLRAESKKGPLVRHKASPEYRLMREALGQLLTIAEVGLGDLLAVAVPRATKFEELAKRWRRAPLVARLGIHFLMISRDGSVTGWPQGGDRA